MSNLPDALPRLEQTRATPVSAAGLDSGHWLIGFLDDLLGQFRASEEVTFAAVGALLEQHEQAFLRDLETARRMYRTYPHLLRAGA